MKIDKNDVLKAQNQYLFLVRKNIIKVSGYDVAF